MSASPAELVHNVEDPELPYVTIGDLGMVRSVDIDGPVVRVVLTPTYTGCPATEQIQADVEAALRSADLEAEVEFAMSPPWTTDWITETGRRKLAAAGIGPPGPSHPGSSVAVDAPVECPRCGSRQTRRLADFGATACKAPYRCQACREPFEAFKAF